MTHKIKGFALVALQAGRRVLTRVREKTWVAHEGLKVDLKDCSVVIEGFHTAGRPGLQLLNRSCAQAAGCRKLFL